MNNANLLLYMKQYDYQDGFQHWVKGNGFDLEQVWNQCEHAGWLRRLADCPEVEWKMTKEDHQKVVQNLRELFDAEAVEAGIRRQVRSHIREIACKMVTQDAECCLLQKILD